MSAPLFNLPNAQPLSDSGTIQPGCYLRYYLTQTTTPTDVYADGSLGTPLANPVVSDDAGRFVPIYLDPKITYRVQLYTAANVLLSDVDPLFPISGRFIGEIVEYFGNIADIPAGWANCDGTNGTPDKRDRTSVGVSNTKPVGQTGGSAGLTGTTGPAGAHDHGGNTGSVTLNLTQIPAHGHSIYGANVGSSDVVEGFATAGQNVAIAGDKDQTHAVIAANSAGTQLIANAGGGTGHAHVIAAQGDHTHTISGTIDPPYIALYSLMFTG